MDDYYDVELLQRIEDRYDGSIEEFLEIMQITTVELVKAFYPRVLLYKHDLDVGGEDDGDIE